jgi:hypothetical protein
MRRRKGESEFVVNVKKHSPEMANVQSRG